MYADERAKLIERVRITVSNTAVDFVAEEWDAFPESFYPEEGINKMRTLNDERAIYKKVVETIISGYRGEYFIEVDDYYQSCAENVTKQLRELDFEAVVIAQFFSKKQKKVFRKFSKVSKVFRIFRLDSYYIDIIYYK